MFGETDVNYYGMSCEFYQVLSPCVNLNFADEEGVDMKDEESDGALGDEADDEGEVAE